MSAVVTLGEPMVMFVADEPGPLETAEHYSRFVAGAELNVSIGLRRLGHDVTYMTRLGEDPFGRYIFNLLKQEGIDTAGVEFDPQHPTGFQLKSRVLQGDPKVVYFRKHSAASRLSLTDIERVDLADVRHVHVTGVSLALSVECRNAVALLIQRAKVRSIPLTFDPNLRPSLWPDEEAMISTVNSFALKCDIVMPGLEEGRILTGKDRAVDIAKYYRERGVRGVIVKLGPEGAYVDYEDESFCMAGFRVDEVVDTVGAGDGFAVGVISGLLDGLPIREAALRGNAIGAMQLTVIGDNNGLPDTTQLEDFINQSRLSSPR